MSVRSETGSCAIVNIRTYDCALDEDTISTLASHMGFKKTKSSGNIFISVSDPLNKLSISWVNGRTSNDRTNYYSINVEISPTSIKSAEDIALKIAPLLFRTKEAQFRDEFSRDFEQDLAMRGIRLPL